MKRESARVTLHDAQASNMLDKWTDVLELRRDRYAQFSVWARKYGCDDQGKQRWFPWDKTQGLKAPLEVMKGIEDEAEFLGIDLDWDDAIDQIAELDWLTAAVLAHHRKLPVPSLPGFDVLNAQRSYRKFKRVRIGAEWGYDLHEISVPFERWLSIVGGESWSLSEPYLYEGQRFTGDWSFDGAGGLEVGIDDGGVGWVGDLSGVDLIEGPVIDGIDVAKLALRASDEY